MEKVEEKVDDLEVVTAVLRVYKLTRQYESGDGAHNQFKRARVVSPR